MIYSMLKLRNLKVAITLLAMDLQLRKFTTTQYIKKEINNIFDKNPLYSIVFEL